MTRSPLVLRILEVDPELLMHGSRGARGKPGDGRLCRATPGAYRLPDHPPQDLHWTIVHASIGRRVLRATCRPFR